MDFQVTDEQQHCLDLFGEGVGLAVNAGAGSGKTSVLKLMAESAPNRRGQYLAFNRAIVEEAQRKMPTSVAASTIHSLAMKSKGKQFRHRLDAPRMHSDQLARLLGMDPLVVKYDDKPRTCSRRHITLLLSTHLDRRVAHVTRHMTRSTIEDDAGVGPVGYGNLGNTETGSALPAGLSETRHAGGTRLQNEPPLTQGEEQPCTN